MYLLWLLAVLPSLIEAFAFVQKLCSKGLWIGSHQIKNVIVCATFSCSRWDVGVSIWAYFVAFIYMHVLWACGPFYLPFLPPCRHLCLPPLSPFFSPSVLQLCSREEERQVGVQEGRGREWEDDKTGRWEFLHRHAGRLGFDVLLPVSVFFCGVLPCLQWHIVRAAFWTVGVYTDISIAARSFIGTVCERCFFFFSDSA